MSPSVASADELRNWALSQATPRHALEPPHALCWLAADTAGYNLEEQQAVAAWLARAPCPTIGVGPRDPGGACEAASDVLVENLASAEPILAGISRNPIAATVLVQVLRLTETLPLEAALLAESLAYSTLQAGPEFHRWLQVHHPSPVPANDAGPAVLMRREDDVLRIELNRPSNRNAMSIEIRDALVEALDLVLADDSIRSLRITARGRCFSTGGDLREFGSAPDPATAHLIRGLALPGRLLARCAARAQIYLHGACVGSGIEFPAFAGRITAASDAFFQLPELRMGLIPGAGGCVSIPRRIGRQRTAWMVLSGRRINVQTALEWGLVDTIRDTRD